MATSPDVSVVIPTRGRPDVLHRSVLSALSQTHSSLEVVVVVDGEDAGTVAAIEAIPDARLRMVALKESVGGSEARNVGVREARGTWIALLDDDDEWLPDKIEKQIALAKTAVTPNYVVVTQYVYRKIGMADEVWPGHLPAKTEPLSEFLFSSCGGFQTSVYLCPRELFLRVPFVKGLKKHQDWDWFLRLAAEPGFELLIVPEPLSIYWVPPPKKAGVSGQIDWVFSFDWATKNLDKMTRRAYAQFLVKICARSAAIQGADTGVVWKLFRQFLLVGRPTPYMVAEFAAAFLMPDSLRSKLRERFLPRTLPPQPPPTPLNHIPNS